MPLLMMIILSVVFSNLFKFDVENFPLYLLSGQIVFNFYSESIYPLRLGKVDDEIGDIYTFISSRFFPAITKERGKS